MSDKTLVVVFDPPALPPAVLIVGDLTLLPGQPTELPAETAQALIDDPEMNVLLASDAPASPDDPQVPQVPQTPPETGADTTKEN